MIDIVHVEEFFNILPLRELNKCARVCKNGSDFWIIIQKYFGLNMKLNLILIFAGVLAHLTKFTGVFTENEP